MRPISKWCAKNKRHETKLEIEDQGDGIVLVTLESEHKGDHDLGIAFWLDYTQSQDLALWLLQREAP